MKPMREVVEMREANIKVMIRFVTLVLVEQQVARTTSLIGKNKNFAERIVNGLIVKATYQGITG